MKVAACLALVASASAFAPEVRYNSCLHTWTLEGEGAACCKQYTLHLPVACLVNEVLESRLMI